MRVYIVRHGETKWNKQNRWQGTKDIPLSAEGIRQSELLSYKLTRFDITRIYSSPLSRALETAKIIQEKIQEKKQEINQVEIVIKDTLKEIPIGQWEGLTPFEMEKFGGTLYERWNTNEDADVGFGIENFGSIQNRALNALREICLEEKGDVLVVAHGTWLRALLCKLLFIPIAYRDCFEISNTGMSVIDYNRESHSFKVITINAVYT